MPLASSAELEETGVLIIGAGSAGIAAARTLRAHHVPILMLEARHRIGGRAHTVMMRSHPIDCGAHWLHAGMANPLVRLGLERGERLRKAPVQGHVFVGRRHGTRAQARALDQAFTKADHALTLGARQSEDQPAAQALPLLGPWRERVEAIHGLVCGRPLDEVSLHDFPSLEYEDNYFIAGGYGAYLARLAKDLPLRLNTPVTQLEWRGEGVKAHTPSGIVCAKSALITIPMTVLQQGVLRFTPELPQIHQEAIHAFRAGTYEHVILHWPSAPFQGPDRLASFIGGRLNTGGWLTRIDGTPFHYVELDHKTIESLPNRNRAQAISFHVRAMLRERFGARAIHDARVLGVTDWRGDPFARGSWPVLPPGTAPARNILKNPIAHRLWFAGEALSRSQWGTVGGAWLEGERAAREMIIK